MELLVNRKITFSALSFVVLLWTAQARPGRIDKATIKTREDIFSRTRSVEVQRVESNHEGGYQVLATSQLDEAGSRELIAQFRRLPFERVTIAQCHEPGFALRLFDSDRNEVVTISLCWDCQNLQAARQSPAEFREYKEDFAADSKRGLSFQRRLDRLVPKPAESPTKRPLRIQSQDELFDNLGGETSRRLGDDLIQFERNDIGVRLVAPGGREVYRIDAPLWLEEAISSENHRVLLLLLTRTDVHALLRHYGIVRLRLDSQNRLEVAEFMRAVSFENRKLWVEDIGAVSNDGQIALLRVSRPHRVSSDQTIYFYDWQTWDIERPMKIGDGLAVSHGKR
jgi:hypothetical protein